MIRATWSGVKHGCSAEVGSGRLHAPSGFDGISRTLAAHLKTCLTMMARS